MPTREQREIAVLREKVEALEAEVKTMKAAKSKPAPKNTKKS